MRPTRRQFLGAAGLVLTGCGGPGGGGRDFRGQKLRIFVYAGGHEKTMREAFVPVFEERTGATAILDPGWWGSTAKLKTSLKGRPAYDFMVSDATEGYPAIREGLFQKIDLDRVPNHKNLSPCVLENWVFKEGYGITFPDSVMTLAYHKERCPFTPRRWDDLLRPEVTKKVGLYNSFYMSLYTFACMKAAREGKAGKVAAEANGDLDDVLSFARKQRGQVSIWWRTSSEMADQLGQGGCVLGNMHSPEMLQVLRERPELGAVVPEEDRAFVQSMWLIPDGTPRKELAETAMDLIFSAEMQFAFARHGSASAVPSVARKMAKDDPFWGQIYPSTDAQLQTLRYYPYDAYFRDWDHVGKVWDSQVLRGG